MPAKRGPSPAKAAAPYKPRHGRRPPPKAGTGKHRAAGPPASARAAAAVTRSRRAATTSAKASGKAADIGRKGIAHGGQHALMAEFLLFCGIVGMRAIADYVPQDEGASKGKITPSPGQLGPLPILAGGFALFFVLSFMAARGGTWAKTAAIFGLIVDLTLLMRSGPELLTVSAAFPAATQTAKPDNNAAAGPNNVGSAPTPTGA